MLDTLRMAVIMPLAAAIVTGCLFGLLVCALGAWRGWPALYGFIAAAAAAFITWLGWSARVASLVEYTIVPDKPKATPTQDTGPQTINLHVHREDESGNVIEGAFVDSLPISGEGLARLAELVISGQSLTTSAMTATGISRAAWESLRDRFIRAGLLEWRGGTRVHGVECTVRGLTIFRRLADSRPSPPTPPPARIR